MQKSRYPPDRCYQLAYSNQSHGWLLDDERPAPAAASEMKHSYRGRPNEPQQGARYRDLYNKAWNEVVRDIVEERARKPPVEEYCTEYNGNFSANVMAPPSAKEREEAKRRELRMKYPLYTAQPMTFYRDRCQRTSLPSELKKVNRSDMMFRRTGTFTRPIQDVMDPPPDGF